MQNTIFVLLFITIVNIFACSGEKSPETVNEYYSHVSNKLYAEVDIEKANELIAEADQKFAEDASWQKWSKRFRRDISVIGKSAPPALELSWLANKSDIDTQSGTLLIVFWELWCPHCKREVPVLDALYQEYHPKGLQMVGLTRLSRNISTTKVKDFISAEKVTYPIAKTGSASSQYFSVSGIPDAVVLHNGKVVWKGNPKALPTDKLAQWVGQ